MGDASSSVARWKQLMALAATQLGLVSRQQILDAGFSEIVIKPRLRDGQWFRIFRGWFKTGPGPMSLEQRQLATQLIAGPGAALSHLTAARRLGLDVPRTALIDVTVPFGRHGARYGGARIFRTRELGPEDVRVDGPFRVTTPERTVIDVASQLEGQWLSAMVYSALRKGPEMGNRLFFALLSQGSGRKGARRVRALLERKTGELGIPRSAAESFFNELADRAGFRPVAQYRLGARQRVDFAFPAHKVVVEIDSWTHHASFFAYRTDRQRDLSAVRDGWTPLRFTWHDVTEDRDKTVRAILEVLRPRSPQRELFSSS